MVLHNEAQIEHYIQYMQALNCFSKFCTYIKIKIENEFFADRLFYIRMNANRKLIPKVKIEH